MKNKIDRIDRIVSKKSIQISIDLFFWGITILNWSGPVVQRLEPSAHNGVVVGSNPTGPTSFHVKNRVFTFFSKVTLFMRSSVTEALRPLCFVFNDNLIQLVCSPNRANSLQMAFFSPNHVHWRFSLVYLVHEI